MIVFSLLGPLGGSAASEASRPGGQLFGVGWRCEQGGGVNEKGSLACESALARCRDGVRTCTPVPKPSVPQPSGEVPVVYSIIAPRSSWGLELHRERCATFCDEVSRDLNEGLTPRSDRSGLGDTMRSVDLARRREEPSPRVEGPRYTVEKPWLFGPAT